MFANGASKVLVVFGSLSLAGCPTDTVGPGVDGSADTDGTGGGRDSDTGGNSDLPGDCIDPYDPNDSREVATSIDATGTIDATLCKTADEVDWWTFDLSETSYVGVEVLFALDDQDLRLELWDAASGSLIGRAEDGAGIQAIHELLEPGSYEILVERRSGSPTYTLETYALSTATPQPGRGGATRVFCPRFDLDLGYKDASLAAEMREDFGLLDDVDRWLPPAMLVQVLDEEGAVLRGWEPLDADGCTAPVWTPASTDTDFVLRYALWSHFVRPQLPDTFMIVYDCEQMEPCRLPRPYVPWTTGQGAALVETRFVASANPGEEFREELMVYWATAFSESRVTMGVAAHIYARVLGSADLGGEQYLECPTGYCPNGTTCESTTQIDFDHCRPKSRGTRNIGGHPTLDIASGAVDGADESGAPESKFTISHELGHVQTLWVPGMGLMIEDVNYRWCNLVGGDDNWHALDSPEWQAAAMIEGFADFYATAVYNRIEMGAWYERVEDVENDTQRFQAQCPASLANLLETDESNCKQPGDATSCNDAGASNEIDWAGTLWDFTKVVGADQLPGVLLLLSDAGNLNWDHGSTTPNAYNNMVQAAILRFPANGVDFDAAAQANGTAR
jgi:hypothetical protein